MRASEQIARGGLAIRLWLNIETGSIIIACAALLKVVQMINGQTKAILASSVNEMQTALEAALLRSRRDPNGLEAVVDLLLAQVASVIDLGADDRIRMNRAEYCVSKLLALVGAMAEIRAADDSGKLGGIAGCPHPKDRVTRLQ